MKVKTVFCGSYSTAFLVCCSETMLKDDCMYVCMYVCIYVHIIYVCMCVCLCKDEYS
jgi:hypothetical protein